MGGAITTRTGQATREAVLWRTYLAAAARHRAEGSLSSLVAALTAWRAWADAFSGRSR